MSDPTRFDKLVSFMKRVPSIEGNIATGVFESGCWWVKFSLDIAHPLAWHVVQEFGSVLNYVSVDERLPTVFMPVSPPPYLNGGPAGFLAWVMESTSTGFSPDDAAAWLEGRLPRPVEDLSQWESGDSG